MVFADNSQRGPYSVSQLENFRRNGELPKDALVWTEGMTDWQPIATVVSMPDSTRAPNPPAQNKLSMVPSSSDGALDSDYTFLLIAHILMGVAVLTGGLTGIIAVIMAYVKKPDVTGTYLESHTKWIAETFWWSLAISIIGFILTFVLIGIPVLIGVWIWSIYRVVLGAIRISERRAI